MVFDTLHVRSAQYRVHSFAYLSRKRRPSAGELLLASWCFLCYIWSWGSSSGVLMRLWQPVIASWSVGAERLFVSSRPLSPLPRSRSRTRGDGLPSARLAKSFARHMLAALPSTSAAVRSTCVAATTNNAQWGCTCCDTVECRPGESQEPRIPLWSKAMLDAPEQKKTRGLPAPLSPITQLAAIERACQDLANCYSLPKVKDQ
jgi:hypothetical protein